MSTHDLATPETPAEAIARLVASAPPLSEATRARLRALLAPAAAAVSGQTKSPTAGQQSSPQSENAMSTTKETTAGKAAESSEVVA